MGCRPMKRKKNLLRLITVIIMHSTHYLFLIGRKRLGFRETPKCRKDEERKLTSVHDCNVGTDSDCSVDSPQHRRQSGN